MSVTGTSEACGLDSDGAFEQVAGLVEGTAKIVRRMAGVAGATEKLAKVPEKVSQDAKSGVPRAAITVAKSTAKIVGRKVSVLGPVSAGIKVLDAESSFDRTLYCAQCLGKAALLAKDFLPSVVGDASDTLVLAASTIQSAQNFRETWDVTDGCALLIDAGSLLCSLSSVPYVREAVATLKTLEAGNKIRKVASKYLFTSSVPVRGTLDLFEVSSKDLEKSSESGLSCVRGERSVAADIRAEGVWVKITDASSSSAADAFALTQGKRNLLKACRKALGPGTGEITMQATTRFGAYPIAFRQTQRSLQGAYSYKVH